MDQDQAFLVEELQKAQQSGNPSAIKLVFLRYQHAVLSTLQAFEPCQETCAHIDLRLLKKRVEKLSIQTDRYVATVEVLPMQQIQALINESRTLFRDIAQLCPNCHQAIKQAILENFRATP